MTPELVSPFHVPLLVPDLPSSEDLLPWLRRIDATRRYSNFGPLLGEFERGLARHWSSAGDTCAVVGLSSGTQALALTMAALDPPAGGKVLMPAYTFPAAAGVALRAGLRPVFADVDPETWQLTPALATRAAERHDLALAMPAASFGCPVDAAAWDAFAEASGIPVLIDAAGAFGNQAVGRRCHVAFSFHATKPLGVGEGGALATFDAGLAARVRGLSNFGMARGVALEAGTNAKLSEIAAAVGLAQLARWPALRARRREQWLAYAPRLAALPGVRLQRGAGPERTPSALVARLPTDAAAVAEVLARGGIETRRWYWPPLPLHPAFAACPRVGPADAGELPVTGLLAARTLGLPWHTRLTAAQRDAVATGLACALAECAEREARDAGA